MAHSYAVTVPMPQIFNGMDASDRHFAFAGRSICATSPLTKSDYDYTTAQIFSQISGAAMVYQLLRE
jgi:hypothetical protein